MPATVLLKARDRAWLEADQPAGLPFRSPPAVLVGRLDESASYLRYITWGDYWAVVPALLAAGVVLTAGAAAGACAATCGSDPAQGGDGASVRSLDLPAAV